MKHQILKLLLLVACLPLLQGCATVLSDREYPVAIENMGGQTYFAIRNHKNELIHQGVTPEQVTLDAKASPFRRARYNVTFAGTSNASEQRELKAGFDPWIAGNVVFGGVPGAVVDGATGAMFKLPEKVTANIPGQFAVTDLAQGARIAAQHAAPKTSIDASDIEVQQVEYQAALDQLMSRQ